MEYEGLIVNSQELSTFSYSEPDQSNYIHINTISGFGSEQANPLIILKSEKILKLTIKSLAKIYYVYIESQFMNVF
jgi:hypothetical protein